MIKLLSSSQGSTLTEEPKLPRSQKLLKSWDEGACPRRYLVPKDRYHHVYFEALELAAAEIERLFNQSDLQLMKELELLLIKAGNGEKVKPISESVWEVFRNDVDPDHWMVQLSMIPNLIKTAFADNITIKKVTTVRTIDDATNQNEIYKGMFNEANKLLKIIYILHFLLLVQQPKYHFPFFVELKLSYEVL